MASGNKPFVDIVVIIIPEGALSAFDCHVRNVAVLGACRQLFGGQPELRMIANKARGGHERALGRSLRGRLLRRGHISSIGTSVLRGSVLTEGPLEARPAAAFPVISAVLAARWATAVALIAQPLFDGFPAKQVYLAVPYMRKYSGIRIFARQDHRNSEDTAHVVERDQASVIGLAGL